MKSPEQSPFAEGEADPLLAPPELPKISAAGVQMAAIAPPAEAESPQVISDASQAEVAPIIRAALDNNADDQTSALELLRQVQSEAGDLPSVNVTALLAAELERQTESRATSPTELAAASPAAANAARDFAEVTGSAVNLRAGPSTGNSVVGQVREGQKVEWLSEAATGWAEIRHPDTGEPVYMSSRYLKRLSN
ncbi:MAG: SH3 domain-containing protein [Mangrovicoccus sp.]